MATMYAAFYDPSISGSNKTFVISGTFAAHNAASELELVGLYLNRETVPGNWVWDRVFLSVDATFTPVAPPGAAIESSSWKTT